MAKKDYFVNKNSLTKSGVFIAKGTKVSLDEKESTKLVSLGNIEEYNSEKHDAKGNQNLKIEEENETLVLKLDGLAKENEALALKFNELTKQNEGLLKDYQAAKKEIEKLTKGQ